MSIIFTTAYKNINRKSWNHYGRTNEAYFDGFINLASNIKYKLVVYVEDDINNELLQKMNFGSNIIFINMQTIDTFYNQFLESDRKIINSEEYKRLIPDGRKINPEHIYSEYNLINHSKINFLKNTSIIFPEYDYYSWIDFGTINFNIGNIPKIVNFDMLSPKIIYHCLQPPPTVRRTEVDMLRTDDIFFTGSSFIVYKDLIGEFESIYKNKIIEWQSKGITDDDQNLVYQIYYDHPELFQIILNPEWFALYRMISS